MIRKVQIIGTLIVAFTLAALSSPSGLNRIASSAQNFEHHFQNLKTGNSLNPVERLVFSLVLANTENAGSKKITAIGPHS